MQEINKKIYEHKHIIIGGDNLNSLSITRSLGEMGISPTTIIIKENHIPHVKHSKYTGTYIETNSFDESLNVLLTHADSAKPPFVYTSDDHHQSMLDKNYDKLSGKFYFFHAGDTGRITHYMDKEVLCKLAELSGFKTPRREVVNLGELPKRINYPVITKTINSYSAGWKRDVGIYYSEKKLAEAYKDMISEKLIIQEYINKKNEFEVHGFSINEGEQIYLSYYSLYYRFKDTTFGGYKYYQILKDKSVEEKIKKMIKQVRYTGNFEVEFLVDNNDELVFLEINFRFPLSNYACTFGGINMPVLWASSTLENQIIYPKKYKDFFTAKNELMDFQQTVSSKQMSLFKWLLETIKTDCLFIFNKKDIKPTIIIWLGKILKKSKLLKKL
jgi:D-aspartate ligase